MSELIQDQPGTSWTCHFMSLGLGLLCKSPGSHLVPSDAAVMSRALRFCDSHTRVTFLFQMKYYVWLNK